MKIIARKTLRGVQDIAWNFLIYFNLGENSLPA